MKKIIIYIILTTLISAKIDFKKHIELDNNKNSDIQLAVTRVPKSDVLNLRLEPSYKSKIIYKIPYDAKNLTTYDREILKKLGKNRWVSVRVNFNGGFYSGWVKAKYIKLYKHYRAISAKDLVVIYPIFLKAKKIKDDWIEIYNRVGFEHYSGCDERDNPTLLYEFSRFDIKLKVYYSLRDFFSEDINYDSSIYRKVVIGGWFKRNNKRFKRVKFYGLRGYRDIIGAEGCGVNIYFFRIKGKILVIKEPFDKNPPIDKDGNRVLKKLDFDDKDEIMRYIIKNLRVF